MEVINGMITPAQRILQYIDDNGIRQTHIANKTGIERKTLNDKLHGRSRITAEEIELICWALGRSPSDFLKPRQPQKAGA
jgi:transcriptional regulator with XRE-family HTH domain